MTAEQCAGNNGPAAGSCVPIRRAAAAREVTDLFLMVGITQGKKEISSDQLVICGQCGSYGRYQVFVTFNQLLLFFIPCFRWGRKYYVQMSCCGTLYELDPEAGREIEQGTGRQIRQEDLRLISGRGNARKIRRCPSCGYQTDEDFDFCPKCGEKLD